MRVEPSADSGPAKRYARKLLDGRTRAPHGLLHLACVAAKFLPEPDRCRVLQGGAARLDQRPELAALGIEGLAQLLEGRDQLVLARLRGPVLYPGGVDIVGRLARVELSG